MFDNIRCAHCGKELTGDDVSTGQCPKCKNDIISEDMIEEEVM